MLVIGAQDAVNLLRFFDDLPDPRSNVNRLHRLGDVIVMAICAVLANADGPTAMAQWAKLNAAWLRRHLTLPGGIPRKDTFRRVLGLLPPAAFQQCFQQWLQSAMAEIFWLASYPKSGNTWLRILLANIRAGGEADIDRLAQYGLSGAFSRIVFDRYCGFKSSNLPVAVCECLRPRIFRMLAAQVPIPQVLKVHDAWRLTPRGEPLFPPDITAGAIYIMRNVLDVAPSAADHWNVDCAEAVRRISNADSAMITNPQMLAPGLRQFLGTWSGHIASWVDRSGLPLLVVRYEDLIADTGAVLAKVLTFLGWSADDAAIRRAVEASGFARLQQRECDGGFHERPLHARSLFFRRGQVGSWRVELSPDLVRNLIDSHGAMMRRFGYLDDKENPT